MSFSAGKAGGRRRLGCRDTACYSHVVRLHGSLTQVRRVRGSSLDSSSIRSLGFSLRATDPTNSPHENDC